MLEHDVSTAAATFNSVCDVIDEYLIPLKEGEVFLGYMSDFAHVPTDKRPEVLDQLLAQAPPGFPDVFRAALTLYPQGPAFWLAAGGGGGESASSVLHTMRRLVQSLRNPQSKKAVQCRMLGLNRLLKHRLIHFSKDVVDDELAEGILNYPMTDEETTERVEQFVRLAMNSVLSQRGLTDWAGHFGDSNFRNLGCQ